MLHGHDHLTRQSRWSFMTTQHASSAPTKPTALHRLAALLTPITAQPQHKPHVSPHTIEHASIWLGRKRNIHREFAGFKPGSGKRSNVCYPP